MGAAAVDYLRVAGHLVFGYLFARMAQVALREIAKTATPTRSTAPSCRRRALLCQAVP